MLSPSEIAAIQDERARYETPVAAIPAALRLVQNAHRWVSDEHVRDIATVLGLPPEDVDSAATFYSLIYRRPVGRHVILLCDSVSCWIMGAPSLMEYLQGKLGLEMGQTTPDDRFTLLPVACLGACDLAPAMMVDEDLHGPLTEARVDEILERYP